MAQAGACLRKGLEQLHWVGCALAPGRTEPKVKVKIPPRTMFLLGGPQCECQDCFCSRAQRWCEQTPARTL